MVLVQLPVHSVVTYIFGGGVDGQEAIWPVEEYRG